MTASIDAGMPLPAHQLGLVLAFVGVAALPAWAQGSVEPLARQNMAMLALGCVAAWPERQPARRRVVLA